MKYALNIAADGRILSATFEQYAPADAVLEDELPTGNTEAERNIENWLYVDGAYVYDPLPEHESEPETPSQLDRVEAQAVYTAMMTDTLLEV